jgi:tetrahydromethanopterin S-methyltransferase subunit D
MLGFITVHLVVIGGATAALQTARGITRGVGKLVAGEPGAALAEMVGGLVAPLVSLANQAMRLIDDVHQVAASLGEDPNEDTWLGRAG